MKPWIKMNRKVTLRKKVNLLSLSNLRSLRVKGKTEKQGGKHLNNLWSSDY